ncbi:ICAM1 protein, partial [Balaeniceps rex]|nr:ICAM1 protein [Balaeniceps rex]
FVVAIPALPAAKPWMDDGSCPPRQNWTEGQDETLRCSAQGNPRPRLECAKDDGEPFPTGVPRPVTRAHAGTYRCRATNALGVVVRSISVRVDCEWGRGSWGSWVVLGVLGGP